MAPAADNNNQDLATKKAKLDSNSVVGGVGKKTLRKFLREKLKSCFVVLTLIYFRFPLLIAFLDTLSKLFC